MKKIKIGLVGAGFVSHIHLNAFAQVVGVPVEVAGIVSRTKESAERVAKRSNSSVR